MNHTRGRFFVAGDCVSTYVRGTADFWRRRRTSTSLSLWLCGSISSSLPYRHCPDLRASWHGRRRSKATPPQVHKYRRTYQYHARESVACLGTSEPATTRTAGEKMPSPSRFLGVIDLQPGSLYVLCTSMATVRVHALAVRR
jgi:hypothetical protein